MPTLTIARYELLRLLRKRSTLISTFVLPLLFISIFGLALSSAFEVRDRGIEPVKIALYNSDTPAIKQRLEAFLAASKLDYLQLIPVTSKQELTQKLRQKKVHFGVYIPGGFTESLGKPQAAGWEFYVGANIPKSINAELAFEAFLNQLNLLHAAKLTEATTGDAAALLAADATETAGKTYVKILKLHHYGAIDYYAVHMLIMFLFYSGVTASFSLMHEQKNHTLKRMGSLPIAPSSIIFGKLLGNGLLACCQAFVTIIASRLLFDVNWGSSPLALALVCLLTILASLSLSLLFAFLAKNISGMAANYHMAIIAMTFLCGGFYPEAGGYLDMISRFTPSYWSTGSIIGMIVETEPARWWQQIAVLAGIAVGLMLLALLGYRKSAFAGR